MAWKILEEKSACPCIIPPAPLYKGGQGGLFHVEGGRQMIKIAVPSIILWQ